MNGSECIAEGETGFCGDVPSGLVGEAEGEVARDKGVEGGAGILYSSKNLRRTAGLGSDTVSDTTDTRSDAHGTFHAHRCAPAASETPQTGIDDEERLLFA